MTSLVKTRYNDFSFVIRGDTKQYRVELKKFGGRWNPNLVGGAGWIFSVRRHEDVIDKWLEKITKEDMKEDTYYVSKLFDSDEERRKIMERRKNTLKMKEVKEIEEEVKQNHCLDYLLTIIAVLGFEMFIRYYF